MHMFSILPQGSGHGTPARVQEGFGQCSQRHGVFLGLSCVRPGSLPGSLLPQDILWFSYSYFASYVLWGCKENLLKSIFMEWVWFFHHILHWSMPKICFSLPSARMFIPVVLKLSPWTEAMLVWLPVLGWVRSLLQTRLCARMLWIAFWFILPILSHSNILITTYRIFPFLCLSSLFPMFHSICLLSLKINHS